MTIKHEALTDEQKERCEQVLTIYTDWLNSHHAANNETWQNDQGETVPVRVTRANYFEYDDSPRLLLDNGPEPQTDYRIMVFALNPYHDEGGPCELTCYFDSYWNYPDDLKGEIGVRHIEQLFDTSFTSIYFEGKLENEGKVEDETVLKREEG